MNIQIGEYRTRDGSKAVVVATNAPGEYPIIGYTIECEEKSFATSWTRAGAYYVGEDREYDLVEPWVKPPVDWDKERPWVKAIAMDESGLWYRYSHVPIEGSTYWKLDMITGDAQLMVKSEEPDFKGPWTESLFIRPEGGGL